MVGSTWRDMLVGHAVPNICDARFDYGAGRSPRRLSGAWRWPVSIITAMAGLAMSFVSTGLLFLQYRLILGRLGLWDDSEVQGK